MGKRRCDPLHILLCIHFFTKASSSQLSLGLLPLRFHYDHFAFAFFFQTLSFRGIRYTI